MMFGLRVEPAPTAETPVTVKEHAVPEPCHRRRHPQNVDSVALVLPGISESVTVEP